MVSFSSCVYSAFATPTAPHGRPFGMVHFPPPYILPNLTSRTGKHQLSLSDEAAGSGRQGGGADGAFCLPYPAPRSHLPLPLPCSRRRLPLSSPACLLSDITGRPPKRAGWVGALTFFTGAFAAAAGALPIFYRDVPGGFVFGRGGLAASSSAPTRSVAASADWRRATLPLPQHT